MSTDGLVPAQMLIIHWCGADLGLHDDSPVHAPVHVYSLRLALQCLASSSNSLMWCRSRHPTRAAHADYNYCFSSYTSCHHNYELPCTINHPVCVCFDNSAALAVATTETLSMQQLSPACTTTLPLNLDCTCPRLQISGASIMESFLLPSHCRLFFPVSVSLAVQSPNSSPKMVDHQHLQWLVHPMCTFIIQVHSPAL